MEYIYRLLRRFLKNRLDVQHEREDEREINEIISNGVVFRGANLWVLILAVFIASLGLNTNSTAVIIGAMLISPLMGPIMGFGFGLGINDFELIKRSFRNFFIATIFSVLTSTLYFLVSPLSEAQSELLARTQPTIYDVMIAFFGGMAGMLAVSIKQKGNVIPGVAIATALMPPLCTAGYGLATGNLGYFFGAFYLYFINTVFISLATLVVVRALKFQRIVILDPLKDRRVRMYIGCIAFFTILPSVYLSYRMIVRNYTKTMISNFVNNELQFPETQIVNKKIIEKGDSIYLDVLLLGDRIPNVMVEDAEKKMMRYDLDNVVLNIKQGIGEQKENLDVNELKSMLLTDLYEMREKSLLKKVAEVDSLQKELKEYKKLNKLSQTLLPEVRVLFPSIELLSVNKSEIVNTLNGEDDNVILIYVEVNQPIDKSDREQLKKWISARTGMNNVKLVIERAII